MSFFWHLGEERMKKKLLKKEEMVELLKSKNIKFEYISEEQAKKYLRENNNYANLTSYKNNFLKYPSPAGNMEGKYLDLDFVYLIDLVIIDFKLRLLLFDMILDIEHYLKIKILNKMENIKEEDGYIIINEFLASDYSNGGKVHANIKHKLGKDNFQKVYSKYDEDKNGKLEDIPIWEFLEMITFGELVDFYDFYTKKYNLKVEHKDVFILRDIVRLRNATFHNNNILSDLGIKDNNRLLDYEICKFLDKCNINANVRLDKLCNSRIRQITYTLYMFNKIVTSEGVKEHVREKIYDLFFIRIKRNKHYYNNNELLKSIYDYFYKIIEKYYRIDKNSLTL